MISLCDTCLYRNNLSPPCPCEWLKNDVNAYDGNNCDDYLDTTKMTKSEIDEMVYTREKKKLVSYIDFYERNLIHAMKQYQKFLLENLK